MEYAKLIELQEVFGSDLTVVNAARVSFAKESIEFKEQDAKLIRYLARHNHTSPFFHPQIRFRLKMPIFVAREWFRHTVGFARNEVSRRYVDTPPELWLPSPPLIRARDPKAKQGSRPDPVEDSELAHKIMKNTLEKCMESYRRLLEMGVAPEIARVVLPQSMFTEFIETGSLAAYARLCGLRLDPTAQYEIRQYAQQISDILADKFPVSWAALSEGWAPQQVPLVQKEIPHQQQPLTPPSTPSNLTDQSSNLGWGC